MPSVTTALRHHGVARSGRAGGKHTSSNKDRVGPVVEDGPQEVDVGSFWERVEEALANRARKRRSPG